MNIFFYTCEATQLVWRMCSSLLDFEFHKCSWKEVLFGREGRNVGKLQLINHVLILVKYLLYKARDLKKTPSFNEIRNSVLGDKVEEQKLATVRETLAIHYSKWENLIISQTIRTQSQPSIGRGGN